MGTTTTNFGLYKPAAGERGWDAAVNTSTDTIDTLLAARMTDFPFVFSLPGTLSTKVDQNRWPIPYACTVVGWGAMVITAPTGSAITFNLKRNGATLFSVVPQIASGSNTSTSGTLIASPTLTAGQYLTVDITTVGSTTAGGNLSGYVLLRKT